VQSYEKKLTFASEKRRFLQQSKKMQEFSQKREVCSDG